jgi:predicted nucleotidyltransferase
MKPTIPNNWKDKLTVDWLPNRLIFACVTGSWAYGTATPTSDVDIRGVAIPPKDYLLGFHKKFDQQVISTGETDTTVFSLQKYLSLAVDANPNILELLFIDNKDLILVDSPFWATLREHRDLFLTKKAKHTYSGYAYSQLQRIRLHRNYLLNPPKKEPTRQDFGLPNRTVIPKDILGAIDKLSTLEDATSDISVEALTLLDKEKRYSSARREWEQYQVWKKNRNPVRAAMEEKFGVDCKHLSHVVRLYRTGIEILETGKLNVYRADADELLAIKNGAWSYEKAMEWADEQEKRLNIAYENSKLPHSCDVNKVNSLCVSLIENYEGFNKLNTIRFK